MGLFGPEKITLTLEKYDYEPGEIIQGKLSLELKKPKRAKALKVAFVGEKWLDERNQGRRYTNKYPLLRNEIQIDGENEYQRNIYNFELKVPEDVLDKSKNWGEDGVAFIGNKTVQMGERTAALQKKAKKLAMLMTGTTEEAPMGAYDIWYIEAKLEVPFAKDLSNTVEVKLTR